MFALMSKGRRYPVTLIVAQWCIATVGHYDEEMTVGALAEMLAARTRN